MSLMRPLSEFREQMDRLFQDIGEELDFPAIGRSHWRHGMQAMSPLEGRERTWLPAVEVSEEEGAYTIKAEVPGINPDDLTVEVIGNVLSIRGETRTEQKTEKKNVYRSELRYGQFMRQVQLPMDVDSEHIRAEFNHGILELTVPKKEGEARKRIQVNISREKNT